MTGVQTCALPIYKLASKAVLLIRPFLKDWNYSLKNRHEISFVTKKINKFYEKTDRKLKKSNILSKIFYLIRNIFSWFLETRKDWDILSLNIDPSIYYTANQYREAFKLNQLPRKVDKKYRGRKLRQAPCPKSPTPH